MRRRDKVTNMMKANKIAEQYYLESKGILTEGAGMTHAAGFADGSSGFVNSGDMMKEADTLKSKADPNCEHCGGEGSHESSTGNGHDVEVVCSCVK
tara:strand:+ start:892 stop:1179 length:288 start_codon:yes stop_codon:yes gene_type:complete